MPCCGHAHVSLSKPKNQVMCKYIPTGVAAVVMGRWTTGFSKVMVEGWAEGFLSASTYQ